ncbi:MAG: hypothetical protein OJF52_000973 [Nitrospira sp.]|nr:hypothetical protein [Nitrospira sp.]WHZ14138.1 MAG: hypothetical protein OJF52_000973 [Nitrospira sp.]
MNREAYLADMPQPVLKRETNGASRTTNEGGGFLTILHDHHPVAS